MSYGKRRTKAYPVTEGDVKALVRVGTFAALSFTVMAGALGFAVDVHKDLALSSGVAATEVAYWKLWRNIGFGVAIVTALLGLWFVRSGHNQWTGIKDETTFDDDTKR